jgi:hypothetical protein
VHLPVAVEKLILGELRENSSRQEALQAIFSGWVDIFYHRIRGRFHRKRVFQQPRLLAPTELGPTGATGDNWSSNPLFGQSSQSR